MTTVLIVTDQALQGLGLRMFLQTQTDLTVVGDVIGSDQAVQAAIALQPDVVLLDIDRPDIERVRTIRRITRPKSRDRKPCADLVSRLPPQVLVLTPCDIDEYSYAALRAGAAGLLLRDALPGEVTTAIHLVAHGGSVLSPRLTAALVKAVREHGATDIRERTLKLSRLTEREIEVLTALASGWSNTEISEQLCIAPTTIKTHISNILTKIGGRARVQAVVFAYETGLVRPPWQQPRPHDSGSSVHR
ncbi:response regulator transcription factor [Streptomyces tauricus]